MSAVIIIIDLEATCCNMGGVPRDEMESIEIGAVAARADTGEVIAEYQTFIRPLRHPQLSAFCMGLTSIEQDWVDAAPTLPEALPAFAQWLAAQAPDQWGSWGDYDRKQFAGDCQFHGLVNPLPLRHRNIKEEFARTLGRGKKQGVTDALATLGLEFEGVHHRGLDDAKNIARIYQRMVTESQ